MRLILVNDIVVEKGTSAYYLWQWCQTYNNNAPWTIYAEYARNTRILRLHPETGVTLSYEVEEK